jgi:hypothetical protein
MNPYAVFRLATLVAIAGCTGAVAQNSADEPRSAEAKAAAFQSVLRSYRFQPPVASAGADQLCPAIFEALRSRIGVKIIEPEFMTNDTDDPRLAKYRACRDFQAWPPGIGNSNVAFHDLYTAGDRNYALYRLDGEELVYAEMSRDRQELGEFGGYMAVDLPRCMISEKVPIKQYDTRWNGESAYLKHASAVTVFRGEYLIADLSDMAWLFRRHPDEGPAYDLDVWRMKSGQIKYACGWVQEPNQE